MTTAAVRKIEVEITGGIPVLLPMPSDYLPERHLEALRAIEAEAAKGRKTVAQRLALDLEKRLGITMEDRIAALTAANEDDAKLEGALVRAAATALEPKPISRRQRRKSPFKPLAEPTSEDVSVIVLPDDERGRSKDEVRRWDRSRQVLLNPRERLSDDQKQAYAAIMDDVETHPARRREESALAAHLEAKAAKAERDGHRVERSKTGRVNVVSWDAVKSLGQSKALSQEDIDLAAAFKGLYETRASDAGAMDYGAIRGSGHDHEAFVAKRAERAFACEIIGHAERAIAMRCEAPSLQMFRAVLDQNIALSGFGKGRTYERHLDALKSALRVAKEEWARLVAERRSRQGVAVQPR